MSDPTDRVAHLLALPEISDPAELTELLYRELRQLAGRLLAKERPEHTLQPTALVHEAWLRLVDGGALLTNDEAEPDHKLAESRFYRYGARVMRQVLVDHARQSGAEKRGGGKHRSPLDGLAARGPAALDELLDIESALTKLEQTDPIAVHVAELRIFAGLNQSEIAENMGIDRKRVGRLWALAKAMLSKLLAEADVTDSAPDFTDPGP